MSDQFNRRGFLVRTTAAIAAAYVGVPSKAHGELERTGDASTSSRPKNGSVNHAKNRAVYQSNSIDEDHTGHLVTDGSKLTYWQPQPSGEQWIAVDLGKLQEIHGATIEWGESCAQSYSIEVSRETEHPKQWSNIYETSSGRGGTEDIPLKAIEAHFVRLTVHVPTSGLSIMEFSIWGGDSSVSDPRQRQNPMGRDGGLLTHGWFLQNAMFASNSTEPPLPGDRTEDGWLPAIVPGTVLASYLAAGAIPDPYYGRQIEQLSEDFFTCNDFWYRNSFTIAPDCRGRRMWLIFDGINWKADVYLNGKRLGEIDGAFIRGRFDVTEAAHVGVVNHLVVLIRKVANPGKFQHKVLHQKYSNGGVLGLDSPTFLSSIGWNWVPTIPGRNIGIWNYVHFETTGDVVLEDPWVSTQLPLPDLSVADLTVKTEIRNLSGEERTVSVVLNMNKQEFKKDITLRPNELRSIAINKDDWSTLHVVSPRLWWPNGYGDAPLHTMKIRLRCKSEALDEKSVTYGIREMGFSEEGSTLKVLVNGVKISCRGGNWGMEDGMLICDPEGYDLRVRMHKDMNLVMIRNWIGMIGRDAFYEACDRHGVLIWDDFWLANPVDGPEPTDHAMFMKNAEDKIRRVRSHPSLALYCGRNEGVPPADLDTGLRDTVQKLDGSRYYISASDRGLVTGHGPYDNQDPEWYFEHRGGTFHTEQGIVCVPPVESMRAMMPAQDLWPISDTWAFHDYQDPRSVLYTDRIRRRYGEPVSIEDYCRKSQMVNLESGKAIFECLQSKQGSGQLIWMSQAAWPALICQLYDYYFEQTSAYFGAKTGCRPVHILWDQHTNLIKAANSTHIHERGLQAEAWVYDLKGRELWRKDTRLDLASSSTESCFALERPASYDQTFFLRLKLSKGKELVSENFYWGSSNGGNYADLAHLASVKLLASAHMVTDQKKRTITAKISNPNNSVALAIRLKLVQGSRAERVLPVMYEDNYFTLLPHETKSISIQVESVKNVSRPLRLIVEGWNIEQVEALIS